LYISTNKLLVQSVVYTIKKFRSNIENIDTKMYLDGF